VESDSDRQLSEVSAGPEVHEAPDVTKPSTPDTTAIYKAGLANAIKAAIELKKQLAANTSPVAPSQPFLKPTFQRPFSATYYVNPAVNDSTRQDSGNSNSSNNVSLYDNINKKNEINASWDRSVRPSTAPTRTLYMKINNYKKVIRSKQRTEVKKNGKQKNEPPPPTGNKTSRKTSDNLFSNSNNHTPRPPTDHSPTPKTIEELISNQEASKISNNTNKNNNNANSNDNDNSPKKSPPQRSTPFLSYKTAFSPHSPDSIRSSTFSPRSPPTSTNNGVSPFLYTSATTGSQPKSKSTSQMNTRPVKSAYVHTGQPRIVAQDPISVGMKLRYAIDKKHTCTSHEDYGMFVKSMRKVEHGRNQLMDKQHKLRNLTQSLPGSPAIDTPRTF
jgi:hypothetical protein